MLRAQKKITVDELTNNVGNIVTVCDRIVDGRFLQTSADKITLLNIGGRFPYQKLTIVIPAESRGVFPSAPELFFPNKTVCITGKVELFREKPQIRLSSANNITDAAGTAFVSSNNGAPLASNPTNATTSAPNNPTPPAGAQPRAERRIDEPNAKRGERLRPIPQENLLGEPTAIKQTFEAGFSFGMMHGLADIGRKKSAIFPTNVDWKKTNANASIFAGVGFTEKLGARLELTFGRIEGDDKNGKYGRNMTYRTNILEFAAMGEYAPFAGTSIMPYAIAGVGLFHFKPQVNYNGTWVNAQPLRLEGQGFNEFPERRKYKTTQASLPVGMGLKSRFSPRTTFKLEWLYRFTSTDYLDDASTFGIDPTLFVKYLPAGQAGVASALTNANARGIQRGGSAKDHFLTMNAKLAFTLRR
jgi:opacity protein-like surface antigen